MTLPEAEVEWFNEFEEDRAAVKSAIWSDEDWKAFVTEYGPYDALYLVTEFHRDVADQLKAAGIIDRKQSEWGRRAINLCSRLKNRRNVLRRFMRENGRESDVDQINREVNDE